jgi:polyphosphate kinase
MKAHTKAKIKNVPSLFINREASWLNFNRRVLAMAQDASVPLMERLKFLAITGSNLDEFCMVRLGSLLTMERNGRVNETDIAGIDIPAQLQLVRQGIASLAKTQYRCLDELKAKLVQHDLRCLTADAVLPESDNERLRQVVHEQFLPVLTPISLDLDQPADPLPLLENLSLYLLVRFADAKPRQPRFAAISLHSVPRIIHLPSHDGQQRFMLAEDVMTRHLDAWFPGIGIAEAGAFRITRNADLAVQEDEDDDLLAGMEEVLASRQSSFIVRLGTTPTLSLETTERLVHWLGVNPLDHYRLPGPLDLSIFRKVAGMPGFDSLRDPAWEPQPAASVPAKGLLFDAIAKKDILLIHPYESFDPVVRFLEEAAEDPDVLAIKQTLYRTGANSRIIAALVRAAENGKAVTALVELKARFDEERNIDWARQLEIAGIQVIYGVKGYKTHAKASLVVRREASGIVKYLHLGTGNYNEITARLYSDLSLLTVDPTLGQDATAFFNAVCGLSAPTQLARLAMAPLYLRDRLLAIIDQAIEQAVDGQKPVLSAKMNSLADEILIRRLYDASAAGVRIRLNIRGICCLRPGVKGHSDLIRVVSIVDRFLEHARVVTLQAGNETRAWISSADWMPRNLDRRVELLAPVEDPNCKDRLLEWLEACFLDNTHAWELAADGTWKRISPVHKTPRRLQEDFCIAARRQRRRRQTPAMLEPHRPKKPAPGRRP